MAFMKMTKQTCNQYKLAKVCLHCFHSLATLTTYTDNSAKVLCSACRKPHKLKKINSKKATFDRMANGNQFRAFNSDED